MNYLKLELRKFWIAVWFLTRLPIPSWVGFQEEWLETCAKYFSLVGYGIGTLAFVSFYTAQFFFSPDLAFVLSLGVSILITGAFHEDGFGDFCDGVGGGWNKEEILRIMKDSRMGSFGVLGLVLLMLWKYSSGSEALQDWTRGKLTVAPAFVPLTVLQTWLYFVTAHSFSRFVSSSLLYFGEYAREEGKANPMAKQMSLGDVIFSGILGSIPLGILACFSPGYLFSLVPILLGVGYLVRLMNKWLGGFTGDCLGAVQQVAEASLWWGGIFLWNST